MIDVRTIRSLEEFESLESPWNVLLGRSQTVSIFLTWEWISTWVKVYLDPGQLLCLAVYDDGQLIGIAPLWIDRVRRFGFSRRDLRFLGVTVAPDHLDMIIDKEHAVPALQAIWHELFGPLRSEWDRLLLEDAASGSQLLRTFYKMSDNEDRCVRREVAGITVCPFIKLPHTFDELLTSLGSKTRYGLNKARKTLTSQGKVEFRVCRTEAELRDSMSWLIEAHQKAWASRGQPGAFARPRFLAFHQKVAEELLRRGWLALYSIWLDDTHIASSYGFEFNGVAMGYLAGVDLEYDKRLSIGKVLLSNCIEQGLNNGCREFDLLRGDEAYKYHWTDRERHNFTLVLYNATLPTFVYLFLSFMRELSKGFLRQLRPGKGSPLPAQRDRTKAATPSEVHKTKAQVS